MTFNSGNRVLVTRAFFLFSALFIICASALPARPAHAGGDDGVRFELVLGGGINLNGAASSQTLIGPALSVPFRGRRDIRLRVEGTLEFLHGDGESAYVAGAGPFVRFYRPSGARWRPFVELGAGANYISVTRFGHRRLGGHFTFSVMAGAGAKGVFAGSPVSLSLRYRHLSNAYIYDNNMGLDALYLIFTIGRYPRHGQPYGV